METTKDIVSFRKAAVFYDYENEGINIELKKARRCVIKNFH